MALKAWKVVGPDYAGGIYQPGHRLKLRKLIFQPGSEVVDLHHQGFSVHTRLEVAYQHARCNPGTRLVELEFDDARDVWGSGAGPPSPGNGWARIRRARVVRELDVDRGDVSQEEAEAGGWVIPLQSGGQMVERAEELFARFAKDDPSERAVHGIEHVRRVTEFGRLLTKRTPGADPMVVTVFAALHDACRPPDRDHGARAAELARSLHRDGHLLLDREQLETLCRALKDHSRGLTTTDPTVGTCWDSDRLDLPRCGIKVERRFLSTAAGKARGS